MTTAQTNFKKYNIELGKNIKTRRKKVGWSQRELAFYAEITNISQLGQYETGHHAPHITKLQRIALVLGVTVNDLLPSADLIDK